MRPLALFVIAACGSSSPAPDLDAAATGCALTDDTSATSTTSASGCAVLDRDTSACASARTTAGLDGVWLAFSCRVDLSVDGETVHAVSDGLPDTRSNYFTTGDPCHEDYTGGIQNPNTIATEHYVVSFPRTPAGNGAQMRTAVVGLAVNGVAVFGNFAAPGDDIYQEAKTFDRCAGHPSPPGQYHYHAEPLAITDDDARLVGVIRDGSPVYGRRDVDGTVPTDLDADGGHTGITAESATPVYHYHVNLQMNASGESEYFITTGLYHASEGDCSGCD